jgi:hypothetical protein
MTVSVPSLNNISQNFPITSAEYIILEKKFGQLAYYAAWQLSKKNTNNNHYFDIEDFQQEFMIAVIRAGSYYKRQNYIQKSFAKIDRYASTPFEKLMLKQLKNLWSLRTRHGASRQKFGPKQEEILDGLVRICVPKGEQPTMSDPLVLDAKFVIYAKRILWNSSNNVGRKITKIKHISANQVSINNFDYFV